ncbi:12452_t:CDS:2 [Entrophospora sp. SA101]|nr:6123_t:CDS:2 [Entrophospora sp. SA101]CAJ0761070.1 12452_t:CDS:2 [Entrophospora sp. SA101]CAJ0823372.1 4298_t:CDS:2 [Entrophospora sp. SA101]CAJ0920795.1 17013_t:CDS:2 [Entrophospora sp. SA101]
MSDKMEISNKHYSVEEVETPNNENDYPPITVSATDTTTTKLMPPPPEENTAPFPNNCKKDLSRNPNIFPNHYNLVLIISSRIEEFNRRKLLRKLLFNINDNLIPCMHQDNNEQPFHNIYYQFLAKSDKNIKDYKARKFIAEKMEYNDLTEITDNGVDDWQASMLKWSQTLNDELCISYDFLVIQDSLTLPNLIKLQKVLYSKTSLIGNNNIKDKRNLIWGSFRTNLTDNMFTVLGSNIIPKILEVPLITIVEWPNSIDSISSGIDNVIAIGNIYQNWIMTDLLSGLSIEQIIPCKSRMNLKKTSTTLNRYNNVDLNKSSRPSIAIITSSYLYSDDCMNVAGILSADNKRVYANKHGYAFVARSTEYWQQTFRVRQKVWGKIDFVETILPYYEWVVWLDMDAIFVNRIFSIEQLFEKIKERMIGENDERDFNDINFIVARPAGDHMINAGVFLIRNTDWSFRFLRAVQGRIDRAFSGSIEQAALKDTIKEHKWGNQVYRIEKDDHVMNTFPDRYLPGDFIIHYAPVGHCPAKQVTKGLRKLKKIETIKGYNADLPF